MDKECFEHNLQRALLEVPDYRGEFLVVTKYLTPTEMSFLEQTSVVDIAEQRVQLLKEKYAFWQNRFRWHFIGPLQTNKVKPVVQICSMIHSVDRLKLAYAINEEALKQNKKMSILLQVNLTKDSSRQGFSKDQIKDIYKELKEAKGLNIEGLMTMGFLISEASDRRVSEEKIRDSFKTVRNLANTLGLKHCSMGMSQDYKIAVEEGATFLRLGRVLYKGWLK
ncbi:YggS family pyridoxal phosphate enzyme [PVC group bacterium (ex Bugula neritina AB1)]|nr:YggS family pyridoxal phosphate enzyme [PVC group bacterium (ex Bugula neritina AB1)]